MLTTGDFDTLAISLFWSWFLTRGGGGLSGTLLIFAPLPQAATPLGETPSYY